MSSQSLEAQLDNKYNTHGPLIVVPMCFGKEIIHAVVDLGFQLNIIHAKVYKKCIHLPVDTSKPQELLVLKLVNRGEQVLWSVFCKEDFAVNMIKPSTAMTALSFALLNSSGGGGAAYDVQSEQQQFLLIPTGRWRQRLWYGAARDVEATEPINIESVGWEDRMLDTDILMPQGHYDDVEAEVRAYLTKAHPAVNSVAFWQTIKPTSPPSLHLQWTFYPYRDLLCLAKMTTACHNRINPDPMESLQVLKFSIKRGRRLDFTAGTSQDDELMELEVYNAQRLGAPQDITVFLDL
ncbi:hypothetical protein BDN71DRAFT_1434481 [Pleurotus eryngii]|uniref:Uncharacterized protein n=1 Tax=Pleurotus eryngii TaxID=5323 RepID=A0A9P5ZLX8_PLEER|nr:hypothetical protein BDN71DRAFT_1434481 [Pleurotus eryngii]